VLIRYKPAPLTLSGTFDNKYLIMRQLVCLIVYMGKMPWQIKRLAVMQEERDKRRSCGVPNLNAVYF
jgi:hypothetical protein